MLSVQSSEYKRVARAIESFMSIDLTGTGLAARLHRRLVDKQGPFPCMEAAQLITQTIQAGSGPVLILTGFPQGGGVPETDGPIGAALLARALFLAFNVESLILVDEGHEQMMRETCVGAGVIPLPLPADGVIRPVEFARPVYVQGIPVAAAASRPAIDQIFEKTRPALVISIERPGANDRGLYSGFGGRSLDGMVADFDQVLRRAKDTGVPFIGIGDGGNELGMGLLADDLRQWYPKAVDAGQGRGGVAAVGVADHVVVASVSNWAATGIIAALSMLHERALILHEPEIEQRAIARCCATGCVDGITSSPDHVVDGVGAPEWLGLAQALKGTLRRTIGDAVSWNGSTGSWMQLKDVD